jgi:hypothetical protein
MPLGEAAAGHNGSLAEKQDARGLPLQVHEKTIMLSEACPEYG